MICYVPRVPEVLVTWIGHADLRAVKRTRRSASVRSPKLWMPGDSTPRFLLTDHGDEAATYVRWLETRSGATEINLLPEQLTGPTDFGEIYGAAVRACEQALATKRGAALTFHLSPGTPAMAAVWIIPGEDEVSRSDDRVVARARSPDCVGPSSTSQRTSCPICSVSPTGSWSVLSAGLPPERLPSSTRSFHRSPVMQRVILARSSRGAALRARPSGRRDGKPARS